MIEQSAPPVNYAQLNARVLKQVPEGYLLVSEIFGPTFQGEGSTLGHPCLFLRLGGCNQHCVWCDTPYTWKWDEYDPKVETSIRSIQEVYAELMITRELDKLGMLVISGGEPMMQQRSLVPLLRSLDRHYIAVEVETAGTVVPLAVFESYVTQFNVSPKLENSGNPHQQRYRPKALDELQATGKAKWKFVATDPEDFAEIDELVDRHDLDPVYIMPEGKEEAAVVESLQRVAQAALDRGYRLTTRLHVLIYGNLRGV